MEWVEFDAVKPAPLALDGAAPAPISLGRRRPLFVGHDRTTQGGSTRTRRSSLHTARCVVAHHDLTADDRCFNSLPLFHINAEVVALLSSLVAGSCLVLDDRFHRTGFWELMGERRVTWINAVPAIISRLAELRPDETVPAGVRFIRSASAPLPVATADRFEERTGIPVVETYGMTEAASQITAHPLSVPRRAGSVGVPVGVELRVVERLAETAPTRVPARPRWARSRSAGRR